MWQMILKWWDRRQSHQAILGQDQLIWQERLAKKYPEYQKNLAKKQKYDRIDQRVKSIFGMMALLAMICALIWTIGHPHSAIRFNAQPSMAEIVFLACYPLFFIAPLLWSYDAIASRGWLPQGFSFPHLMPRALVPLAFLLVWDAVNIHLYQKFITRFEALEASVGRSSEGVFKGYDPAVWFEEVFFKHAHNIGFLCLCFILLFMLYILVMETTRNIIIFGESSHTAMKELESQEREEEVIFQKQRQAALAERALLEGAIEEQWISKQANSNISECEHELDGPSDIGSVPGVNSEMILPKRIVKRL